MLVKWFFECFFFVDVYFDFYSDKYLKVCWCSLVNKVKNFYEKENYFGCGVGLVLGFYDSVYFDFWLE